MLLFIWRRHHPELPRDPRTILQTPRNCNTKQIPGGYLVNVGLNASLQRSFDALHAQGLPIPTSLNLILNIDGLKLHGSSKRHLWPVLVTAKEFGGRKPFPIAIFWGDSKPTDVHVYLQETVEELHAMLCNGFVWSGASDPIPTHLLSVICDTPARCFVKQVKGHAGYFGCDRCIQKGLRIGHTTTFPNSRAALRTDCNFRNRLNRKHHIGISPFESLPINMVRTFPLDYMHLVCLGAMKRLLDFWTNSPGRPFYRMSVNQRQELNGRIKGLHHYIPVEFQRKCRDLDMLSLWKATEYR